LTIEETYELGDAILDNDLPEIKKELGDLLLHIVFYAKIGSETKDFDITTVIDSICEKLIHRHQGKKSVLEGVPNSLPAMVKASRIQDKVAGVGFDWEEPQQVFEKVQEELAELQEEIVAQDQNKLEAEFGDVLFSMINYARFLKVNPEDALERTNKKFIKRFQYLEAEAKKINKSLADMTLAEMDKYWEQAKKL